MEKQEPTNVEPHIMVISYSLQGHMNPMVQFSKRLISKGIRIILVTTTTINMHPQLTNSINIERISTDPSEGEAPSTIDDYIAIFKLSVSKSLPNIITKQKTNGHPIKVLVYDSLMPWALDIAHKLEIQGVPFFTVSCSVCAVYYHIHEGTLGIPYQGSNCVSLPSMPLLEIKDLPSFVYDIGPYQGLLNLCVDQFSTMKKADCIIFNTFDELEYEIAKWLSSQWPIKTIGPSIPSMFLDKRLPDDKDYGLSLFKPDVEACIKWLNAKDTGSVVYVSFGSLANLAQDHMDEVAWGLLNSNSNFLWVVRETEQNKLPSNFKAEAAEKGLVVSWCPQLEVLAHKAVGSFMTHCGWNSTLEALSLGVPMLVMPQWTDQTTNAKYVVDVWRTGIRVKAPDKEICTRKDIANCIKDVMDGAKGEELRVNAIKWKELAVEAMSEGGSSDKNIDEFILMVISTTA